MVRNLNQHRTNHSFLFWFILLTLNLLFFIVLDASAATQISLVWDANIEADLAGYRVFSREQTLSYDYANPSWEGTGTTCTISNLDETKTYCFVARAFDTQGLESENSVEVCHEPAVITNQLPVADAGPDQIVDEGQTVSLSGSNSHDPDDGIASYHWAQLGEPSVNLSNPDAMQPTFTAPGVGTEGVSLTFELTVVDNGGNQAKDTCVVNVTWQNEPPQANAGPDQEVNEGVVVTLDGSGSVDIDDPIKSYLWKQTGGMGVTLSDPTSIQPTFTAPDVGLDGVSLTFDLTVTDTGEMPNTDSCIVNVTWQNKPPKAVVTPDYAEAEEGTLVTMDGSGSSDPDNGGLLFAWSQVEGDPVTLSDPTAPVTTFTAPKTESPDKNIKLKLTVKDDGGLQGEDEGSILVIQNGTSNILPVASFIFGVAKKLVSFADQSKDDGGSIELWLWDFGDGTTSTDQNPSHRYVRFDTYTVTLTVTDNGGETDTVSKSVTVSN